VKIAKDGLMVKPMAMHHAMLIGHRQQARVCDPMAVKARTSAAEAAALTAIPRSLARA